jgi:hypothetical protein
MGELIRITDFSNIPTAEEDHPAMSLNRVRSLLHNLDKDIR